MSLIDEALLTEIKNQLSQRMPESLYIQWFSQTELLTWEDGRLVLGVQNKFFKERIEHSYLPLVKEVAELTAGQPVRVEVAISPRLFKAFEKSRQHALAEAEKLTLPPSVPAFVSDQGVRLRTTPERMGGLDLNPDFTFDTFVVGPSNRLSHAVALRAVESPGMYNRIYFCGQHGVGKTHLLQAVCRETRHLRPGARVIYVTCERFVADFLAAHAAGKVKDFRALYRGADLLAFDELQALGTGNKAATQAELLGIVDELAAQDRQILFAATHSPAELEGVDPKLRDRLGAGFVDKLTLPDETTRSDIIARKMADRRIDIPKTAVKMLAQELTGNVRLLEGTVSRLAALIECEGMEPTLSCIRMALELSMPATRKSALTFADVIQAVADEFGITPEALIGRGRSLALKKARQLAIVLCRRLIGGRYAELGEAFGQRSHATIISIMKNPPADLFSSGHSGRPLERILFRLGVGIKPEEILERQRGLFEQ